MKRYKDIVITSSDLSVMEGPGDVLLIGSAEGTYVHMTAKQEAQKKYQNLYPKSVFKRFKPQKHDNLMPVPVKHCADQDAYMPKGHRIITHVLTNEKDTVRIAFGGTEDDKPIVVAMRNLSDRYSSFQQYNVLDPGSVFTGFTGSNSDLRVPGTGTYSCPDRDRATDLPNDMWHTSRYKNALDEEDQAYVEKLVARREKIAMRLVKGSLKEGHIGAFKVKKGVFYYDDVTTLEILSKEYKTAAYNRVAACTSEDFYEILQELTCTPYLCDLILDGARQIDSDQQDPDVDYTLTGTPLKLRIRGTELTVDVRRNKKGLLQHYVNGKLVTQADYHPVIERITCYPDATADYQAYVEVVSAISLKYHRLSETGLKMHLGNTGNGTEVLNSVYRWCNTPPEERRKDMPKIEQAQHKFPLPEYAQGRAGNSRGWQSFSMQIPFRKTAATAKPEIHLLGKWRTLENGCSQLDPLMRYISDDYYSGRYRFQKKRSPSVPALLCELPRCVIEDSRYSRTGHLNVNWDGFNSLPPSVRQTIRRFLDEIPENTDSACKHIVKTLAYLDSMLIPEDRVFINGGVTEGVDLSAPGTPDFGSNDPDSYVEAAETFIPWYRLALQHVVGPLLKECADQVEQVEDAVTKSEEILTQAIEDTGSEYVKRYDGHYVKVTGKSGQIYWVNIASGAVSRNGKDGAEDVPGGHLCIVRASRAEFAGHDYVASLVFALHSDLQTADAIYTVNNMLKAEGVVA